LSLLIAQQHPSTSFGHLPAIPFYLFKMNHQIKTEWADQVDLERISRFFIPLHINGDHWALGLMDLQHNIFAVYDSLNHGVIVNYMEDINEVQRRIDVNREKLYSKKESVNFAIQYFEELYKFKGKPFMKPTISENIEIPQQKNALDCGVFTVMYAYYIATNKGQFDLDKFTQEAVHEYRQKIITEIETAIL
jgi:Ulp1 family protease